MSEPHALSKSMFTSRLKHTSVEPMFAARLIADTTSTVTFAPQYGRLWLFDSTLTGQTINGDDFKSPLNQVSSVKVSRFSTGKTFLFAGGLLAVTAGIIGIIWASQDGFFQSGP